MHPAVNTYGPTAEHAARVIVGANAYLVRPNRFFEWKCGIEAPVYLNLRRLRGNPGARSIVKQHLASAVRAIYPPAELIVGMAVAGVTWSALVADELGLPDAFVRTTRKAHGPTASLVDCEPERGSKAVLLDDVCATGESLETAIEALRTEAGVQVLGILSIANWGFEKMHERFSRLKVPVWALVSYPHILAAALEAGRIAQQGVHELLKFYANPFQHEWNLKAFQLTGKANA